MSAVKQHPAWLASLSPQTATKEYCSSAADRKYWHMFSGRHLLRLEKHTLSIAEVARAAQRTSEFHEAMGREPHRDGDSTTFAAFWCRQPPAPPQLDVNSYTASADASRSPGKTYRGMFSHISSIKPTAQSSRKKSNAAKPTWASVKNCLYCFYFKNKSK